MPCPHAPILRCQFFFTVNSVSSNTFHLVFLQLFHLVLLQLHSILFLHLLPIFCFQLFHLCTMLPALQAFRKWSNRLLSLPAENWTCFTEANPHVHCVHTVVHVQLDHCSVSKCFECADYFDNVSGSDNLLHRSKSFDNTRSPECYAPLNSLVCLEWNVLFTPLSDLFHICCDKLLW